MGSGVLAAASRSGLPKPWSEARMATLVRESEMRSPTGKWRLMLYAMGQGATIDSRVGLDRSGSSPASSEVLLAMAGNKDRLCPAHLSRYE